MGWNSVFFGFGQVDTSSGGTVTGSGTTNFIPKWTSATALGNSLAFDNGVSFGINTISPNASALLDLTSTTQGFLTPRLNSGQVTTIFGASPATGLLVYNTTTNLFNYWNGTSISVIDTGTSDFTNGGNAFGGNAILGLTDAFALDIRTNNTSRINILSTGEIGIGTAGVLNTQLSIARTNATPITSITGQSISASSSSVLTTLTGLDISTSNDGITANIKGIWSVISSSNGTVSNASAIIGTINNTNINASSLSSARGLDLSAWSNSTVGAIDTSYGIYMDSSIDIGSTRWAIYSLSTSDSLITGRLGVGGSLSTSTTLTSTGSGSSSATYSLKVQNSTGTSNSLVVRDDTRVFIQNTINAGFGNDPNNSRLNTAFGSRALDSYNGIATTGGNVAFGIDALRLTTSGQNNTALGHIALSSNTIGQENVAIGRSLEGNISGSDNIGIGHVSLQSSTTLSNNIAIGHQSLQIITTGEYNVAVGSNSLGNMTSGTSNVVIGKFGGLLVGTGSNNTFIGSETARTTLTSGSNNTFIGANVDSPSASLSNYILIGDGSGNIRIMSDNAGFIGIGSTSPTAKLFVIGSGSSSATYSLKVQNSTGTNNALVIKDNGTTGMGIDAAASNRLTLSISSAVDNDTPTAIDATANSSADIIVTIGGNFASNSTSLITGTSNHQFGVLGTTSNSAVNQGGMVGVQGRIILSSTATVLNGIGLKSDIFATGTSTITNAKGIDISGWVKAAGATVTTSYGIFMNASIDVGTTKYALYSESVSPSLLSGDFKLNVAGNGIYIKEGTNATMGTATLVAGSAVVSTTKVTANSRIFLMYQSLGTIAIPVSLAVTARTAGTSFTITSSGVTDTSVIAWIILEPTT